MWNMAFWVIIPHNLIAFAVISEKYTAPIVNVI